MFLGSHGVICLLWWVLAKETGKPLTGRASGKKGVAQEGVLEVVGEQRGEGVGRRRGRAVLGVDLEVRSHLGGSPDHTKMTSLPWRMTLPLGTGSASASGSSSQRS